MKESYYRTNHLYEAAFLVASKINFKLEKEEHSNKFTFIFPNTELLEKISESFWRGEALINAKEYADAIRTLKERITQRSLNDS